MLSSEPQYSHTWVSSLDMRYVSATAFMCVEPLRTGAKPPSHGAWQGSPSSSWNDAVQLVQIPDERGGVEFFTYPEHLRLVVGDDPVPDDLFVAAGVVDVDRFPDGTHSLYPWMTSLTKKDPSCVIMVKPRLFRREMSHIASSHHLSYCWLMFAFMCTGSGSSWKSPKRTTSS